MPRADCTGSKRAFRQCCDAGRRRGGGIHRFALRLLTPAGSDARSDKLAKKLGVKLGPLGRTAAGKRERISPHVQCCRTTQSQDVLADNSNTVADNPHSVAGHLLEDALPKASHIWPSRVCQGTALASIGRGDASQPSPATSHGMLMRLAPTPMSTSRILADKPNTRPKNVEEPTLPILACISSIFGAPERFRDARRRSLHKIGPIHIMFAWPLSKDDAHTIRRSGAHLP